MQDLVIQSLGHLGDGLAAGPEGPVHVPLTLPGERVRGDVAEGRMAAAEVLEPAASRVTPPCPAFGACGGCAVQHGSDGFVAGWKADLVRRALAARGLGCEIEGVETSPPASRRRATFSARRTRKGVTVGFHARASDRLVGAEACQVIHPDLTAALPVVADLALTGASRAGEVQAQVTRSLTGLDIDLTGGKPLDADLRLRLAGVAAAHDLARLTWAGEVIAQSRPPQHRFGPATVLPPPGAFLQATEAGEAALQAAVLAITAGAGRVLDLFAGCGTFALPLSARAEVQAVEGDAAMAAAMAQGWRQAGGLRRLTVEVRDLFRRPLAGAELAGWDAVVIDPPRAGAREQAAALAASRVPVIAALSCNPASFARDAATLVAGGYRMGPVRVIDQFRWSAHVELAAAFRRD